MTQLEGLVALRALVEEQKEELGKKDRIIREKDDRIKEKDDRIEQQDRRIRQLDIQVDNMIQALLHARKKMFGPSTEAKGQIEGQLSLFESVQTLAKDLGLEQKRSRSSPIPAHPDSQGSVRRCSRASPRRSRSTSSPRMTGAVCAVRR